ncbi:MAG: tyrosine--tRNA ligase, partial [Candidatus Pacebacteria bacterium]|nr:tyrosine--tRNA ligase [Candidatus Paceibacterota bacterium]
GEIGANMAGYQKQFGLILDMDKVELRYNSEWLSQLNFKDVLGLAMNFTAQQMIQRRNFKERWESASPIGLHELMYPLMQGYDSVAIKADVELGGFDQLFNLKAGREIQRASKQPPQDIMTLKMLYGLDGRKMSTSWGNVINITDEPGDMYGKVMSLKDELIGDYWELTTRLPLEEVGQIKKTLTEGQINPRDIKAKLAREIVRLYHGEKEAEGAEREFEKIFRSKELPSDIPDFQAQKPTYPILDLLADSGLAGSKSEAKRLVTGKAIEINDAIHDDWKEQVEIKDGMVIRAGKRKFIKVKLK